MKHRLEIAVVVWMAFFLTAAWALVGFPRPMIAHAATAGDTCRLETWAPHQIPGPAVEFDAQFTGCQNTHNFDITVVGYKDGVAWANWEDDALVCIRSTSCGDSTSRAKAWGCHTYQTETWGTVDQVAYGPLWGGTWYGCR